MNYLRAKGLQFILTGFLKNTNGSEGPVMLVTGVTGSAYHWNEKLKDKRTKQVREQKMMIFEKINEQHFFSDAILMLLLRLYAVFL